MPRGDRTGPWGMGPLTGRRAGYCADYDVPGFANPAPGRGYGRGWGRGWRHRFYATGRPRWSYGPVWDYPPPLTREQELEGLRHEAQWLKGQLDAIGQRIENLEGE
jgi:hypothetical protein